MDEYAWQSYGDPKSLLAYLRKSGQARDRKLRLWACACCRRLWELLGQGYRDYVALAELVADGEAGEKELFSVAWDRAEAERNAEGRPGRSAAAQAACYAGNPSASTAAEYAPQSAQDAAELAETGRLHAGTVPQRRIAERLAQIDLLRCVFANPFRPVTLAPSWLTEDVTSLAKAAYAERLLPRGEFDPVGLAVLGDALEEAGAAADAATAAAVATIERWYWRPTSDPATSSKWHPAVEGALTVLRATSTWRFIMLTRCAAALAERHAQGASGVGTADTLEQGAQADLLRCIFGNPFRPGSFDRVWYSPTLRSISQAAYEERCLPSDNLDGATLAVMADLLEDAGFTDETILSHLRSPGPHVRGCWALDLILGKS
jgi:hypothetical protein